MRKPWGRWPEAAEFVLIPLLPKGEGGYRAIGLLPFLPRLWMRTRKHVAAEWEASMQKPYLYAGKKMGVTAAAWKQGFRAELAAESGRSVNYSEALLDLVKAFDLVPHWVLIREGLALGYPLWLLRLSLATYKMKRVVRVRKVVYRLIWAFRGMTAGSGFATTEMRVAMINLVEKKP